MSEKEKTEITTILWDLVLCLSVFVITVEVWGFVYHLDRDALQICGGVVQPQPLRPGWHFTTCKVENLLTSADFKFGQSREGAPHRARIEFEVDPSNAPLWFRSHGWLEPTELVQYGIVAARVAFAELLYVDLVAKPGDGVFDAYDRLDSSQAKAWLESVNHRLEERLNGDEPKVFKNFRCTVSAP